MEGTDEGAARSCPGIKFYLTISFASGGTPSLSGPIWTRTPAIEPVLQPSGYHRASPKGVLYRTDLTVLHSFGINLGRTASRSPQKDVVLPCAHCIPRQRFAGARPMPCAYGRRRDGDARPRVWMAQSLVKAD